MTPGATVRFRFGSGHLVGRIQQVFASGNLAIKDATGVTHVVTRGNVKEVLRDE